MPKKQPRPNDWKPKIAVKYLVTQVEYTCGILPDGDLGVLETKTETTPFDLESDARKAIDFLVVNSLGAKDVKSKIVESKSKIKDNDFGFVKSEGEGYVAYSMYDTRGEYPCTFLDLKLEKREFVCSRSKIAPEIPKRGFNENFVFNQDAQEQEIDERRKTLDEFRRMLEQ